MAKVVETVTALVTPILDEHHFELYDVEFVKEAGSWYLRVYIDKEGGITLEDCANVSDALSEKLDSLPEDPIPQQYFLEVSSPGAERPLKKPRDYERAINQYVHISLYAPLKGQHGQKVYEGTLRKVDDEALTIEYMDKTRKKTIDLPRKQVAQARLAIKF